MGKLAELTTPPGWQQAESGLLVPQTCDMNIMMGVTALMMGGGGSANDQSLYGIIQAAGVTSGLQICLDAGDVNSYAGSGQTWTDRSGNGYDFLLGADSSADGTDPAFNGVAGALTSSEYFSLDGGDYFTIDESANPASIEALHMDGATLTALAVLYGPSSWAGYQSICGTGTGAISNARGFRFMCLAGTPGQPGVFVANGSASTLAVDSDTAMATSSWSVVALSINEALGVGGGFFYLNGAYDQVSGADTFNATYSSPSASAAANKLQIGAGGGGNHPLASGARIACFALWSGVALSKANLDAIYGATPAVGLRARFGL